MAQRRQQPGSLQFLAVPVIRNSGAYRFLLPLRSELKTRLPREAARPLAAAAGQGRSFLGLHLGQGCRIPVSFPRAHFCVGGLVVGNASILGRSILPDADRDAANPQNSQDHPKPEQPAPVVHGGPPERCGCRSLTGEAAFTHAVTNALRFGNERAYMPTGVSMDQ